LFGDGYVEEGLQKLLGACGGQRITNTWDNQALAMGLLL
jgi:hypothetical protein